MEIKESASLEMKNEQKLDLLSSLKAELQILDSSKLPLMSSCCIYKVPSKLRKVNEEAYTPTLVSIGPFHHGEKRLESMEKVKMWFLNKFLKRTQVELLEDYVKALKGWESEIRCCYSETIPMQSDKFVRMILIDACFIIEYFLTRLGPSEEDPWRFKEWPETDIRLDLILLENQLPFFLFINLFNLTFPTGFVGKFSFFEVTFYNFTTLFLHIIVPNKEIRKKFTFSYFEQHYLPKHKLPNGDVEVQHLCDMLRIFYLPHGQPPKRKYGTLNHLYSASQLHEAGIEFQVDEGKSIIEFQYLQGVLKIPHFEVSDWTETMIRNVVAFEQCHLPFMSYMTDYITFLDFLINIRKDVEMLVEKGIMDNLLGDNNAVAYMINNLCINIVQSTISSEYISLSEDLTKFYDNPYHKYKAIFKHEYLSTPWKIASFIAAIVLLLLTLIQTICSVISLFN